MKNKKNFDYNSIGFKNSTIDKIGFREAFKQNKAAGKAKFKWRGKEYSTQTAEEKAMGMSNKQLSRAIEKSYVKAKGLTYSKGSSLKRSAIEQANSYVSEKQYRLQEMKDRGQNPRGGAYAKKRPNRLNKK